MMYAINALRVPAVYNHRDVIPAAVLRTDISSKFDGAIIPPKLRWATCGKPMLSRCQAAPGEIFL